MNWSELYQQPFVACDRHNNRPILACACILYCTLHSLFSLILIVIAISCRPQDLGDDRCLARLSLICSLRSY